MVRRVSRYRASLRQQAEEGPSCMVTDLNYVEIPQPGGREERVFTLPDGTQLVLQRVNIRITGTVTVLLETGTTDSTDFTICESYYLCAPTGTDIEVRAAEAGCRICTVSTSEEGTEVTITIDLCQDVQSVASVVVDLEAGFCNPRQQEVERTCLPPVRPRQCPAVFGEEETDPEPETFPILQSSSVEIQPQQEENLCIRTNSVYDWIRSRVDAEFTVLFPPVFCLYTVTDTEGDCGGIVVGDTICYPCETPCPQTLQCSNGVCSLLLELTDDGCVTCPPEAVTLPAGFACEVPGLSCIYVVTEADGDCGDLVVGDLICLPCEAACEDILQCSNGDCTLILSLTDETCTVCPLDAVPLPAGFACEVPVLSCVYEVTEVEGDCAEIVVGDVLCFPCEEPCEEVLQCTNGVCTLVLNRTEETCVFCPPNAVTLPEGFFCGVPSCVYAVGLIEGDCGGLEEGDLICFPCEEPCAETLICGSQTCSLTLNRTSEECVPCPADAVPLPAGITCSIQAGRIYNVNQQTFYDLIAVAVADANDGDTLIVTPGTYTQTAALTIDKPLTIRGFSAGSTLVDFPAPFTAETAVFLQADAITLENLSFTRTFSDVTGDETLIRIPPQGVGDYYSGIVIRDSNLTGGERTLIVNVDDFTLENNTITHTGDEQSLEIRGALGTTTISGNSFIGGATSLAAIRFQPNTPTDEFSGTFLVDDNTMERHSQFVFFENSAFTNVSIFVRRNTINHLDRAGSSIIFYPFNFPGIDTILIEENNITNPNTQRLAVYVDYRDGGTTAPTAGQIQVVRNTLAVALPWGRAFDTVSPDAPVGFTTIGIPFGMSLTAFDLVDNTIIPI
ncbi:UNVERIFIED_CONTAM: right-handed parallel beta-helix repeat-containing protein [Halobacillus marinus]